ncbi:MAG: hypothetical protein MHM6MM_001858 [Cercozoa sp. M6MM]
MVSSTGVHGASANACGFTEIDVALERPHTEFLRRCRCYVYSTADFPGDNYDIILGFDAVARLNVLFDTNTATDSTGAANKRRQLD